MSKRHRYVSKDNLATWLSRLATITLLIIIAMMQLFVIVKGLH
jgi:hypothetical protein